MEMKPLGATDVTVPAIGMGAFRFAGDPEVLSKSLEMGSNLIDTAANYRTEEAVGTAVGSARDDFFIATKVAADDLSHDAVMAAADDSLRKLGTDRIDLYQIHWPNPAFPIKETMRAMGELVDAGRVRYVGVSNFSIRQFEEAQAVFSHQLVSNQVLYNLFSRGIENNIIPWCQEHQVTVIGYSPLVQGGMERAFREQPKLMALLDELSAETGKTHAQLLLNWAVRDPWVISIPQTNKVHRVVENCEASGWHLSPEQYAAMAEAAG